MPCWLLCAAQAASPAPPDWESAAEAAAEPIRLRLEPPASAEALVVAGQPIRATQALPAFYVGRLYQPAWLDGAQGVSEARTQQRLDDILRALAQAERHGLRSADYHLPTLLRLREEARAAPSPGVLSDLDLLLTDGLLIYAAHLVSGRVDAATFDPEWFAVRKEVDLVAWAASAALLDRPSQALDQLLPEDPAYRRLVRSLAVHRAMEPWQQVTPFDAAERKKLTLGDEGQRVLELRLRLDASGELALGDDAESPTNRIFDEELEAAVRLFQARHGLAADGVVGQKTLDAMNVPLSERIVQLEANLERWRWLPRDLGSHHLTVNIPEFALRVVEDGETVLEMSAVVGREHRRTPVMSDRVRYLVINPFWEVPYKLAVEDKLPEIRKDPTYLQREGFEVLQGWGSDEQRVDPDTVDWSQLSRQHFPFRLRQNPGPRNALGRIKFMFPNRFNVYIHDTPTREVFARPERAASSGCIRISGPLDLAEHLLRGSTWDRSRLEAAFSSGETLTVPLPESVPVHLQYWTAWVAEDGTVNFRRDVYGRDAALAAALAEAPPEPLR